MTRRRSQVAALGAVLLGLFAASLLSEGAARAALGGATGVVVAAVVAPGPRDPAGARAVATLPWRPAGNPDATVLPGGGVSVRLPVWPADRRRARHRRTRLPRGAGRAAVLVAIATAASLAVMRDHLQMDCLNLLHGAGGTVCSWRIRATPELAVVLLLLATSVAYALVTFRPRPGTRR